MKRLFGFILLAIIAWVVFHLIRVHDQEIPLSEKQASLLNAENYSSSRDIKITVTEKEEAIIERINSLRAAKGMSALKLDKVAALLALHHSALMRKHGKLDFDLPEDGSLESRKTGIGISDTCFYNLYANVSIPRVLEQIESGKKSLHYKSGLTHMGVGVVRQLYPWRYWVTIIYVKRIANLYDFPVCVPGAHSMQKLRWELGKNYSDPVVKMTTPDGKVKEVRVKKLPGGIYESEIPFRGKGKYTVEILANGPYGAEVAHVIPVYAGIQRENELAQKKYSSREKDGGNLEKAMVELLNHDRAEYGLKPLQFNSRLCEVACIHSRNMAKKGEVAHDLPGCRSLSGRLKDARLKVLKQGENVACAASIEEAHESLMGSPGHRQAILDPGFSSVGVGIVKQDNLLYVTQNFASFIPEVSPSEGKRVLLRKINQTRSSPLQENHMLSTMAQKHSDEMAASSSLLDTGSLKNAIDSSGIKFRKVAFIVVGGLTIEQIAGELGKHKNTRTGSMAEIGIGLRQSNDGSLWVTIILKK